MRLIGYGVGELIDRLTILDLKIAHGGGDHFVNERTALLVKVKARDLTGAAFEATLGLALVNGLLWRAEDDLRLLRRQSGGELREQDAGVIAFRIQELNDQRAALVETINKLTGDHLGQEKI